MSSGTRGDVGVAQLLAYGGPIAGLAFMLFFVQFYFLKFGTDVLLLPPAIVGTLFALAKLWDAVSNPLIGSWSDRSRSRFGRRRPFLLGSLLPMFIGYVVLWNPPDSLAQQPLVLWVGAALFLFFSSYAVYAIPHAALGAEMSSDSHVRTRLFAAKQISFTLGMLIAFGAIQMAMNSPAPRAAAGSMAVPGALMAVVLLAITPLLVREPKARRGGESLVGSLRDVVANQPARILLFVWFVESFGVGAVGTMAPYVAEYLLQRTDVVATLPGAYVVAGIISIPIWVRLSKRYGARDTWLAAMLLAAAAFGCLVFVGAGDLLLVLVVLMVAGAAMGCGTVLVSSLMADLIDLDEQRTGERKEGVYSAALMFMFKIGNSLATVASGFVLGAAGFVPNVEQSAESLAGIRFLIGGLPCIGFILGALFFRRFPLGGRPSAASEPPLVEVLPRVAPEKK